MERLYSFFLKASNLLNKIVEIAIFVMGTLMAVIMGAQVIARYVFNHSIFWSEEVGRIILIWLSFLGATVAHKRKLHVGVDFLVRKLPPKAKRLIYFLVFALCLSFFTMMVIVGLRFVLFATFQRTAALGIPFSFTYSVIPLSGIIFIIHSISHFIEFIKNR